MRLPADLQAACEQVLGARISSVSVLSGGDINQARRLETTAGPVFLKMNTAPQAPEMFATEAKGLEVLARNEFLRIPRVLGVGKSKPYAFLLLEFIASATPMQGFWQNFGQGLAGLHTIRQDQYGLAYDNFIGTLPQKNRAHHSWITFYREERLRPQLRMARDAGRMTAPDSARFEKLFDRLPLLLPEEAPSLIHGDLWSGNYMIDEQGLPVLIDPAVSFSNREADLAMTRLFGGFAPAFYEAYDATFPLTNGWETRMELYQLYYLMVHVNLFGGSYVDSVRRILDAFG